MPLLIGTRRSLLSRAPASAGIGGTLAPGEGGFVTNQATAPLLLDINPRAGYSTSVDGSGNLVIDQIYEMAAGARLYQPTSLGQRPIYNPADPLANNEPTIQFVKANSTFLISDSVLTSICAATFVTVMLVTYLPSTPTTTYRWVEMVNTTVSPRGGFTFSANTSGQFVFLGATSGDSTATMTWGNGTSVAYTQLGLNAWGGVLGGSGEGFRPWSQSAHISGADSGLLYAPMTTSQGALCIGANKGTGNYMEGRMARLLIWGGTAKLSDANQITNYAAATARWGTA